MVLSIPLVQALYENPLGLCGQHDPAAVAGEVADSERRFGILALGVVLDINPLSSERWSRLASLSGHWLFDPSQVAYQSSQKVLADMQETDILGPRHIARVWWQLCRGVQGRFKGSWRALIAANREDANMLQTYLHQNRATFPVLAGPVISARWLDLVHRIGGLKLHDWESLRVPLPQEVLKGARQFSIEENDVHPMLYSALWLWRAACQRQPQDSCGLVDCPLRH